MFLVVFRSKRVFGRTTVSEMRCFCFNLKKDRERERERRWGGREAVRRAECIQEGKRDETRRNKTWGPGGRVVVVTLHPGREGDMLEIDEWVLLRWRSSLD